MLQDLPQSALASNRHPIRLTGIGPAASPAGRRRAALDGGGGGGA
jgi:hypothetical protein